MTGSTGFGDGCGSNDWTLVSEGGKKGGKGGGGGGGRQDACMALHIRAQHTWKALPSSHTEEEEEEVETYLQNIL